MNFEPYSVLLPAYKADNYIERCLESIAKQIIQPAEIIIVDDCYNGNKFYEAIRKFIDKGFPIILISNPRNLGVSNSLNIGLDLTTCKIVFRIDADDEWGKSHSFNMLTRCKKYPNIYLHSLKKMNLRDYLFINFSNIIDNTLIHSSWVFNFNNRDQKIKYEFKSPEDYFMLYSILSNGLNIKSYYNFGEVFYNQNNPNSISKSSFSNNDLNEIKKLIQNYFINKPNIGLFIKLQIYMSEIYFKYKKWKNLPY